MIDITHIVTSSLGFPREKVWVYMMQAIVSFFLTPKYHGDEWYLIKCFIFYLHFLRRHSSFLSQMKIIQAVCRPQVVTRACGTFKVISQGQRAPQGQGLNWLPESDLSISLWFPEKALLCPRKHSVFCT